MSRRLRPGIYAPVPTFFLSISEDIDINAFEANIVRLAKHGVNPLVAGSMGENNHLSREERVLLVKAGRHALDKAGLSQIPIIAGASASSTRETIHICKEVAHAGADFAIVIASGYYAAALNAQALEAFWAEVSENSPIPVIVYNYPGACAGIDLDSDLLINLASHHANLAGVKLTCGNVGKLARICATVSNPDFAVTFPRKNPRAPFLVLCGFADFIVPSLFAHGHGAIIGLANVAPVACIKLFDQAQKALKDPSALPEAQRLQGIIARADFTIAKASIAGTKFLLEKLHGYGGLPRRPLPPFPTESAERLWKHPDVRALLDLEVRCLEEKLAM